MLLQLVLLLSSLLVMVVVMVMLILVHEAGAALRLGAALLAPGKGHVHVAQALAHRRHRRHDLQRRFSA